MSNKLIFRSAAEIFGLTISAVSMIYVSRVVGPAYLGFSAISTAILLLFSRIADGGLTSLATQRLARDDETLDVLLAVIMPPKLLASVTVTIFTWLASDLLNIDSHLEYFLKITVFALLFDVCTPAWIFVALGNIKATSFIRIGQSILTAAYIFIFIQESADWKYLPYLTVFNSFTGFGLAIIFLTQIKRPIFSTHLFNKNYIHVLKTFYREAMHFLKAELSVYVFMSSDRIILYYFTNPVTVGLYEAAYKIISPFYKISEVITPTMFRDLAQAFKRGEIYSTMSKYVFAMSIFTIPLGFFLLFFSQNIIDLLYGPQFSGSSSCLKILGFVITFGFIGGILVLPFSAWNMAKEYGNSIFCGNITNIILNFTLIPIYGAIGAATATLGAKLIVTVVGLTFFKRVTDYPIIADFIYFVAASSIPLIIVYLISFFSLNDYLQMIAYGCVYLGLIAAMNKYLHTGQRSVVR